MSKEARKNKYEIDMCNGPIMRKLISFSVPLVLSSALQLLFNAVDIVVVGKFSGSQSLAAVGSTSALINLMINLFIGISLGANVMAGRYFATRREKDMSNLVHTAMTFALISGVFMSFVGLFFSKGALTLMGTPDDIINLSALYMKIYFMGMPFFMLYNYGAAILRAVGDTKRPLMFLTIAGIVNAVLNMILVIFFNLGVVGVAVATVVAQMISCVLVLNVLFKADASYKLSIKKIGVKMDYLTQLLKIGVPAGIQSIVISFSNVLLQSSVNSFGSIAMAGYTAANNIFGFMFAIVNAFSQTCMSFTSQNYGAKKPKRMDKIFVQCLALSVGVAIVMGCGVYAFGDTVIGMYTTDPEVVKCGVEIFLYTTTTYFIVSIMDLIPCAMRGMGFSVAPMLLSIIGTVGTRVFWIYCIFPTHHALDILFISYPLSWTITVLLQAVCFYFVRKKVHNTLIAD